MHAHAEKPVVDDRRRAVWWMVVACLLLAAAAAIAALAGIDNHVARSISDVRPEWLVSLCGKLTVVGGYTVMIVLTSLATIILALVRDDRRGVLVPALAAIIAISTTNILKQQVDRDRPAPPLATRSVHGKSFPSGHASGTMALAAALVLAARRRRTRQLLAATAMPAAALIAATRPCLGVHYATDVLAGMSLGIASALVAAALLTPTRSWPAAST